MNTPSENDRKIILNIFNRKIPLHKHLNLEFDIDPTPRAIAKSNIPDNAMGYRFVHGGFIATMLDAVGSLQVVINIMLNENLSEKEKLEKVSRVSTIDIRIDFVNPASQEELTATAETIKIGNHVAFIKAEARETNGKIIATSSATYRTG